MMSEWEDKELKEYDTRYIAYNVSNNLDITESVLLQLKNIISKIGAGKEIDVSLLDTKAMEIYKKLESKKLVRTRN